MTAKTVSAKKYNKLSKQLKATNEQMRIIQEKLDAATSSQKVMQQNLDNAYSKVEDYESQGYALQQKYLDMQRSMADRAEAAQQEANEFNAMEAQKQRDWSTAMSASAHQREVKDLQAAGLNPVISAYGSGASVGSGAAASSNNQLTSVFGGIAQSALAAVSQLASTMQTNATSYAKTVMDSSIQARGQDIGYATSTYATDVQKYAADLASSTNMSMNEANIQLQKYLVRVNNLNQKQVAQIAAAANVTSAQVHAAASNYAAEISYASAIKTAEMNNKTSKEIAEMQATKTFEGVATDAIKKAGNAISDFLSGTGVYAVHNYNQSVGQ